MRFKVTVSIVAYNQEINQLKVLIEEILKAQNNITIFLIDNSPSNILEKYSIFPQIQYFHFPENLGFGAGHNYALKKAIENGSKYHFIINPDISLESSTMDFLIDKISINPQIGMLMPQILNFDNTIQYLPKFLPHPLHVIWRKVRFPREMYRSFIEKYELQNLPKDANSFEVPVLSGCFLLLNLSVIKEVGFFDERFFMYFEDWDLSRRVHLKYKTILDTSVSVRHEYCSGANKSLKLFIIFIKSYIKYFNKWGWFVDVERDAINNFCFKNIQNHLIKN